MCANPLIRCDLLTKSSVKILPESEAKILLLRAKSKIWAQKWMNSQSTAVAGSGNPLKSRFESEIQAKRFSKSADPFAYSPLSMRDHPGLGLVCVCFLLSFPGTKFTITRDPPSTCTSWENWSAVPSQQLPHVLYGAGAWRSHLGIKGSLRYKFSLFVDLTVMPW